MERRDVNRFLEEWSKREGLPSFSSNWEIDKASVKGKNHWEFPWFGFGKTRKPRSIANVRALLFNKFCPSRCGFNYLIWLSREKVTAGVVLLFIHIQGELGILWRVFRQHQAATGLITKGVIIKGNCDESFLLEIKSTDKCTLETNAHTSDQESPFVSVPCQVELGGNTAQLREGWYPLVCGVRGKQGNTSRELTV